MKQLILGKNETYKKHVNESKEPRIFGKVKCLQKELDSIIESNKQKYYSRVSKMLVDPMASTKSYWSTLNMFLNNRKIHCIPPLKHQNKYVTDFKEKAEIVNSFLAEQSSLMNNSSKLPSTFLKRTDKFISSILFSSNDIDRIIRDLDPNKADGHDMISIRTLKICGESISKPLEIIFKSCIEKGQFPNKWKKANVVPVHKKGDKQVLRNYRPVSLLSIWGKIFEHLIYNNLYEFFIKNDLISSNQSGFKQGDLCIYQLLSITYEIYQSFDNGFEVRGIFFISPKLLIKFGTKVLLLN